MSNSNFETQYDAIVVGTGISGGWAAKELTEKGLKTLVLERGRMVKHIEDYPTMNKDPWIFLMVIKSHKKQENANLNKVEQVILPPNRKTFLCR